MLFIDSLSIQSIKNGLEELMTNHNLRRNLADNAQENVTRFNWDTAVKQLVSVFEKAISAGDNQHP